jgi:cytochrome P450
MYKSRYKQERLLMEAMPESGPSDMTLPLSYPSDRGNCPFDPPAPYIATQTQRGLRRVMLWDGSTPWIITRHADVRAVLGDSRFSANNLRPNFPFYSEAAAAVAVSNHSFNRMDDPEHQRMRRMLAGAFRAKRMGELRPGIQQIVNDLIDAILAKPAPADLVAEFALPLPSLVICLLLGVPYADHGFFQEHSRVLLDRSRSGGEVQKSNEELKAYLAELTARKVADPDGGLLSQLVHHHETNGEITREEIVQAARLMLVAGHETTANQTAMSILALLRNRHQLDELRRDPNLIPGAADELLRYVSVVHSGLGRFATEDVLLGETLIRAGEGVLCMINVANRDVMEFGSTTDLDVHRDACRNLAFGYGVHYCLGQPLARIELQIALETLLRRMPGLRLLASMEDLTFGHEKIVYGVHSLPVSW